MERAYQGSMVELRQAWQRELENVKVRGQLPSLEYKQYLSKLVLSPNCQAFESGHGLRIARALHTQQLAGLKNRRI